MPSFVLYFNIFYVLIDSTVASVSKISPRPYLLQTLHDQTEGGNADQGQ